MARGVETINIELIKKNLINFIKNTVKEAGFKKVIVGISGGVDSATVAYLSKEALGSLGVIGVMLPYGDIDPDGIKFAKVVIDNLGIKHHIIDIAPMVDAYFRNFPSADNIRRGNKMARERMAILYDLSKEEDALVIGSGNRTEILLGYCTLHGDSACALNPLAGLYKSQVFMLARHIGVPEEIINRKPTAGLWRGQTDEDEIGSSYSVIDGLLRGLVDEKRSENELAEDGFDKELIGRIKNMIKRTEFKRRAPSIP
ncbi:MAG: NAD+ synthase [Candidatus Omnitrophica bacterium]|nr:NAD+ synthase [Candidatus Omnitrophota bacterium]